MPQSQFVYEKADVACIKFYLHSELKGDMTDFFISLFLLFIICVDKSGNEELILQVE
jgi:hypothetical protein